MSLQIFSYSRMVKVLNVFYERKFFLSKEKDSPLPPASILLPRALSYILLASKNAGMIIAYNVR